MSSPLDLLVVGAGPYGLAVAAMAKARGLKTRLLGHPMEFWHRAMPRDMLLRSGKDWHLDPTGRLTYEAFAQEQGWDEDSLEPVTLERFQQYAAAFTARHELLAEPHLLTELRRDSRHFQALTTSGETIPAQRVAICAGVGPFPNLTHPLSSLPEVEHTVSATDLVSYRGQRVLVIGGRQSAFEWAALLAEAGATAVHVVHRHPTPVFQPSDWSWVDAMMEQAEATPGWFAGLSPTSREAITRRFWEEGRLKLEPWLAPRLARPEVTIHAEQDVLGRADGTTYHLSGGQTLQADRVILATGYRMDLSRLPYLRQLRSQLAVEQGFPLLDPSFESSLPGLYFTSFASTRSHGPFFGFVRGATVTARLLVGSIAI